MIADLYLCWAHYYDYCDNFAKAEAVYRKGLDARAQPIELIEQAHRKFGFSMSQRILYKDESTRQEFRTNMDEQRLALTSLRAHKHRHVGSIRTGSAVKSVNPGRLDQSASTSRRSNRKVQVFEDGDVAGAAPTSPTASTSVVQTILNSTKKQENMREPGPWNKAKIKSHALFTGAAGSSKPSFSILEDDDIEPIPLPDSENNYARGIQLPKDFVRKNLPQDEFSFPLHRDEEPSNKTTYKYDKFMLFPAPDKCYSWEELQAYKWFKKRSIQNNFTRAQDAVWQNGHGIPLRLPPHFVRKNAPQDQLEWTPSPFNVEDVLANGQRKFGFDINLIYTPNEEFSPEEILQAKWLNGDLRSQKGAEMEITCGFERREEIYVRNAKRRSMALGGRKSILPRRSNSPRKSISTRMSMTSTSTENAPLPVPLHEPAESSANTEHAENIDAATGAIKRTCLPKRKSVYMTRTLDALCTIPETASPPASRRKLNEDEEMAAIRTKTKPRISIFEDVAESKETEDGSIFKVPQSAPAAAKPRVSSIFQDEDLDGCTTQTFNFFIQSQSISTPKVKQTKLLLEPESAAAMRKELDFGSSDDDHETSPTVERGDDRTGRQAFACRSIDSDQPFVDPHEMFRQKLSAIMETTEECATVSSLAATASSKSSSAEDFDFTKHTNQQSSVAMSTYRHQTIGNITGKMSASNVSVTNRENESKKCSAIGFEIYQEDAPETNDDETALTYQASANVSKSQATVNTTKTANLSKLQQVEIDAFDKTLPAAGQFHIYEDEDQEKSKTIEIQSITNQEKTMTKKTEKEIASKNDEENGQKSIFNVSQEETEPSQWQANSNTEQHFSQIGAVSKCQIDENLTLTTQPIIPQRQTKTVFQMQQEDTGFTLPMINFVEERTEQMPAFFNQTNFTQPIPPIIDTNEAPSIYVPQIPDEDATKNLSQIFGANSLQLDLASTLKPVCSAVPNSQVNADQSVFVFASDDTVTHTFTANLMGDKTETIPKIPNPMQMSLFDAGDMSAFQMIPEMPTMPEIDMNFETTRNASRAVNQSKVDTTLKSNNKTSADQSVFFGSSQKTDLYLNKSNAIEHKMGTSQLMSTESNQMSKIFSTQSDKTLEPFDFPINRNKSISALQNEDQEKENQQTDNIPVGSFVANKSMAKSDKSKLNIDNDFYAMIDSPLKPNQDPDENATSPIADKTSFLLKSFSVDKFEKSKANIDDELYAMIKPTRQSQLEAENFNSDCNKSQYSKSKAAIDDEFYAMIKSPVAKKDKTLPPAMLIVDTPPSPPAPQFIREPVFPERKTVHKISLFREPSISLLEPIKRTSVRESVIPDAPNIASNEQKDVSIETPKTLFCDDNPNTAMFSLHMPSIKNSTILLHSKENIQNITDELKTSLVIGREKSMATIPGE